MEDTIFDKVIRKEIPAKIVFEDEDILAFHDINPQAPIHVLVIPKIKRLGFTALADCSPHEVGTFISKVSRVAKDLGLNQDGYRIVFNQGNHGQQSVNYIHAHILGGKQLSWPPG